MGRSSLRVVRIVGGVVGATVLAFTVSARASEAYVCHQMPSEDCDVDQDCGPLYDDPPSGCDPTGGYCAQNPIVCNAPVTTCTYQNGTATCGYQDVISTPAVVWRSFNGETHAYTAQAAPPQGYYLEGNVFTLANDGYGGAVEFPLTGGGPLFYYPVGDSGALSADPELTPLYRFYNPTYGDYLYTTDPTEAQSFPCTPARCGFSMNGYCLAPIPPNCYLQMEPVFGYVGG
jgi:hypothetical protein